MPYFLYDGQASIGPFEPAQLAARPGFDAGTLVFPAGATGADAWKPAGTFADIAAALSARSAPPPPPPPPSPPPPPAFVPPAPSAPARTEITLTLPPQKFREPEPTLVAAPKPAPAPEPATVVEEAPKLAAPAEKTLLIVDDDENVRSFLELTAGSQGFQIVTAINGLDASKKLESRSPDLIITDLMMPGQGGYEFLRSLQGGGSSRIPVFVVTGSALDSSTVGMIRQEANVVEFIPKPVRVAAFVAALHKHLKTAPR